MYTVPIRDHLFVHVSVSAGNMVSASWFGLRVIGVQSFQRLLAKIQNGACLCCAWMS